MDSNQQIDKIQSTRLYKNDDNKLEKIRLKNLREQGKIKDELISTDKKNTKPNQILPLNLVEDKKQTQKASMRRVITNHIQDSGLISASKYSQIRMQQYQTPVTGEYNDKLIIPTKNNISPRFMKYQKNLAKQMLIRDNNLSAADLRYQPPTNELIGLPERKLIKPKSYKRIFEDKLQQFGTVAIIQRINQSDYRNMNKFTSITKPTSVKNHTPEVVVDDRKKYLKQKQHTQNLTKLLLKEFQARKPFSRNFGFTSATSGPPGINSSQLAGSSKFISTFDETLANNTIMTRNVKCKSSLDVLARKQMTRQGGKGIKFKQNSSRNNCEAVIIDNLEVEDQQPDFPQNKVLDSYRGSPLPTIEYKGQPPNPKILSKLPNSIDKFAEFRKQSKKRANEYEESKFRSIKKVALNELKDAPSKEYSNILQTQLPEKQGSQVSSDYIKRFSTQENVNKRPDQDFSPLIKQVGRKTNEIFQIDTSVKIMDGSQLQNSSNPSPSPTNNKKESKSMKQVEDEKQLIAKKQRKPIFIEPDDEEEDQNAADSNQQFQEANEISQKQLIGSGSQQQLFKRDYRRACTQNRSPHIRTPLKFKKTKKLSPGKKVRKSSPKIVDNSTKKHQGSLQAIIDINIKTNRFKNELMRPNVNNLDSSSRDGNEIIRDGRAMHIEEHRSSSLEAGENQPQSLVELNNYSQTQEFIEKTFGAFQTQRKNSSSIEKLQPDSLCRGNSESALLLHQNRHASQQRSQDYDEQQMKQEQSKMVLCQSMSNLTKSQNQQSQLFISKYQEVERDAIHKKQMQSLMDKQPSLDKAQFFDSKYNFKIINKTGKDIKSAMYQANKVVCDHSNFHILIEPNLPDNMPNKIDLYKNAQFNIKIPLKGLASPLKVKLEFMNSLTKKNLSRAEKNILKSNLSIHVSRFHQNPQANIPGENTKRCEKSYQKMVPPSQIIITASDSAIPGIPFYEEYAYLTLQCQDLELFDELYIEMKAFAQIALRRDGRLRQFSQKDKDEREFTKNDDVELEEYYKREIAYQKQNQSSSHLLQFKKNISQPTLTTVDDEEEHNRAQREAQKQVVDDDFFITQTLDVLDLDNQTTDNNNENQEFDYIKTYQQLRDRATDMLNQQIVTTGDFIQHNRLLVKFGHYDKISKQQKQIELNNDYERKSTINNIRKTQQEILEHKKKVFLVHKNQIIKQIRSQMAENKYQENLSKKRVYSLNKIISLWQFYSKLIANYATLKARRAQERHMALCALKIITRVKMIQKRRGPTLEERCTHVGKYVMIFLSSAKHSSHVEQAQQVLRDFLFESSQIQFQIDTIINYSKKIEKLSILYKHNKHSNELRQEQILLSWDKNIKGNIQNNLKQNQKNPKNQEKLQKLLAIQKDSEIKRDMCSAFYQQSRCVFRIVDFCKNFLSYGDKLDSIYNEINHLLKIRKQKQDMQQDRSDNRNHAGQANIDSESQETDCDHDSQQGHNHKGQTVEQIAQRIDELQQQTIVVDVHMSKLADQIYKKDLARKNGSIFLGFNKKKHFTETIDTDEHFKQLSQDLKQQKPQKTKKANKSSSPQKVQIQGQSVQEIISERVRDIIAEYKVHKNAVRQINTVMNVATTKKLIEQATVIQEYRKIEKENLEEQMKEAQGIKAKKEKGSKKGAEEANHNDHPDDESASLKDKRAKRKTRKESKEKDPANRLTVKSHKNNQKEPSISPRSSKGFQRNSEKN